MIKWFFVFIHLDLTSTHKFFRLKSLKNLLVLIYSKSQSESDFNQSVLGPVLTSRYIFRSQAKNKAPMNFWSSKRKQNQKVKKLSQIPSSESTDFSILLHPWVCKCYQNKNKYLNVLLLVTLPKFVIIQLRQRET